jgi:hypothetical protein
MNTNDLRSTVKVVGALVALGLPFSGWAACIDPSPVTAPSGGLLSVDNYWYTLVGGKVEGCPTGLSLLATFPGGNGSYSYTVFDSSDIPVTITLSSTAEGPAAWKAKCSDADGDRSCAGFALVDAVVTSNAKGGNGCLYSFDLDAASATAGDPGNIRSLYLCSDGEYEPIPAPVEELPPVASCLLDSGVPVDIHGIEVSCPDLDDGEKRTVIVSKDGKFDVLADGSIDFTNFTPAPGFGFTNQAGEIDFNNICLCIGGIEGTETEFQCNPAPEFFTGPAFDGLEPCTVNNALPVTEVQIQNPTCVVQGGRRRCF